MTEDKPIERQPHHCPIHGEELCNDNKMFVHSCVNPNRNRELNITWTERI